MTYKKKCQLLILLCILFIGVIFHRGLQIGLVESVGPRIQYHAMPMAVSVLFHGHPHDYTAIRQIAHPFQGQDSVKHYLTNSIQQKIEQRDTYFWVADDKGSGDYIIAAFILFGPKIFSLYLFWIVCLSFTTGLFAVAFKDRLWCLGLLGLVLIGIYTAISVLPLANEDVFLNAVTSGMGPQSAVAIYEARFFDVLAMIAVFHVCLFALSTRHTLSSWQIIGLLGQVAFFIFLYHSRSSLGWQLLAIAVFLSLIIIIRLWHLRKIKIKKFSFYNRPIFVFSVMTVALVMLFAYKHMAYNPRYFQDMGARTFWHNALMGVYEQNLSQIYKLSVSDFDVAAAVIAYSNQGVCSASVAKLEPQMLLNSLGGHGEQDWVAYESCAKMLYFELWQKHRHLMIYNYTVIKPLAVFSTFQGIAKSIPGTLSESIRKKYSIGWHPLSGVSLIFALIIFLVVNKSLYRRSGKYLSLLSILMLASLIPSIFFYPGVLTLGGFIVVLSICCYFLILLTAIGLIKLSSAIIGKIKLR